MQNVYQPTPKSTTFRTNLACLVSPLRRVRPRVPFWKLAAHRIPTLWSLYRSLLRDAPSENIKHRVRMFFRQDQHLTGADRTKQSLLKAYKFLDAFQRANSGDERQKAILQRYSQALGVKAEKEHMMHLAREELAWQAKLANRPIMTGGFLRPTPYNGPLPRLRPQPWAITSMILKRRRAHERQSQKLIEIEEYWRYLQVEAEFEKELAHFSGEKGKFKPVFDTHIQDWLHPLHQHRALIFQTIPRSQARLNAQYPPELLEAIKAARREKIANKTRELVRERRGEILRRTILRQRKGPPAHVLAMMTPEQRRMDKITRNVSEVGYVAQVKMKLGFKLKNPDAWKAEIGTPEDQERLNREAKELRKESKRREREAIKREKEMGFDIE